MPKVGGFNSFLNKIDGVVEKEFPDLVVIIEDFLSSMLMWAKGELETYARHELDAAFIWKSLSTEYDVACRNRDEEEILKGLLDILNMLEEGAKFRFRGYGGYYTIESFNDYCDGKKSAVTYGDSRGSVVYQAGTVGPFEIDSRTTIEQS